MGLRHSAIVSGKHQSIHKQKHPQCIQPVLLIGCGLRRWPHLQTAAACASEGQNWQKKKKKTAAAVPGSRTQQTIST